MGNPNDFVLFSEAKELMYDYEIPYDVAVRKVAKDYGVTDSDVRAAWHKYCED